MWMYFLTVYFIKSKYKSSNSGENLASRQRCAMFEKYILDFKDQYEKKKVKQGMSKFYIDWNQDT